MHDLLSKSVLRRNSLPASGMLVCLFSTQLCNADSWQDYSLRELVLLSDAIATIEVVRGESVRDDDRMFKTVKVVSVRWASQVWRSPFLPDPETGEIQIEYVNYCADVEVGKTYLVFVKYVGPKTYALTAPLHSFMEVDASKHVRWNRGWDPPAFKIASLSLEQAIDIILKNVPTPGPQRFALVTENPLRGLEKAKEGLRGRVLILCARWPEGSWKPEFGPVLVVRAFVPTRPITSERAASLRELGKRTGLSAEGQYVGGSFRLDRIVDDATKRVVFP